MEPTQPEQMRTLMNAAIQADYQNAIKNTTEVAKPVELPKEYSIFIELSGDPQQSIIKTSGGEVLKYTTNLQINYATDSTQPTATVTFLNPCSISAPVEENKQ